MSVQKTLGRGRQGLVYIGNIRPTMKLSKGIMMKYVMLFILAIALCACESAQKFKRPESSQHWYDASIIDDSESPVFSD